MFGIEVLNQKLLIKKILMKRNKKLKKKYKNKSFFYKFLSRKYKNKYLFSSPFEKKNFQKKF
jgi:hypothetical protein